MIITFSILHLDLQALLISIPSCLNFMIVIPFAIISIKISQEKIHHHHIYLILLHLFLFFLIIFSSSIFIFPKLFYYVSYL